MLVNESDIERASDDDEVMSDLELPKLPGTNKQLRSKSKRVLADDSNEIDGGAGGEELSESQEEANTDQLEEEEEEDDESERLQ
jgi:hypothetical protein